MTCLLQTCDSRYFGNSAAQRVKQAEGRASTTDPQPSDGRRDTLAATKRYRDRHNLTCRWPPALSLPPPRPNARARAHSCLFCGTPLRPIPSSDGIPRLHRQFSAVMSAAAAPRPTAARGSPLPPLGRRAGGHEGRGGPRRRRAAVRRDVPVSRRTAALAALLPLPMPGPVPVPVPAPRRR